MLRNVINNFVGETMVYNPTSGDIIFCKCCESYFQASEIHIKQYHAVPSLYGDSTVTFKCPDCEILMHSAIFKPKFNY